MRSGAAIVNPRRFRLASFNKEDVTRQLKSIAASVLFALASLVSAGASAAGPVTSSVMVHLSTDGIVVQLPGCNTDICH